MAPHPIPNPLRNSLSRKLKHRVLFVVLVPTLSAWLVGALNNYMFSPQRLWTALKYDVPLAVLSPLPNYPPTDNRFRFVLSWLKDDRNGVDTENVAEAFRHLPGVDLRYSAFVIPAPPPADLTAKTVQPRAQRLLDKWNADLAIVGEVSRSETALTIWFVTRHGHGTFQPHYNSQYILQHAHFTLDSRFLQELRAQLVAFALTAVSSLRDSRGRDPLLTLELQSVIDKIHGLLDTKALSGYPTEESKLRYAYGTAMLSLGVHTANPDLLVRAVDTYAESLRNDALREDAPEVWARLQNNLGAAQMHLGLQQNEPHRFLDAIRAFRKSFEANTQVHPERVQSHTNLGAALTVLGAGACGVDELRYAIEILRTTLVTPTPANVTLDSTATRTNLAVAMVMLAARTEDVARMRRAIALLRQTIREIDPDQAPLQWVTSTLGAALVLLGDQTDSVSIVQQGIGELQSVLQGRRQLRPLDWARANLALGRAHGILGRLLDDEAELEKALRYIGLAAEELNRDPFPLDWAGVESSRGVVLRVLGQRTANAARLGEAVAAQRGAARVVSRAQRPGEWALVMTSLGDALMALGEHTGSAADFADAMEAYREARDVCALRDNEGAWAYRQWKRGHALVALANETRDAGRLKEAAEAYRAAADVYPRGGRNWGDTQYDLARALQGRAEWLVGETRAPRWPEIDELWGDAITAYRAALTVYTEDQDAWERIQIQYRIAVALRGRGDVLLHVAEEQSRAGAAGEAVAAYRAALDGYVRHWEGLVGPPHREQIVVGQVYHDLGIALGTQASLTRESVHYAEAIEILRTALEWLPGNVVPQDRALTQEMIGVVLYRWDQEEPSVDKLRDAAAALEAARVAYAGMDGYREEGMRVVRGLQDVAAKLRARTGRE